MLPEVCSLCCERLVIHPNSAVIRAGGYQELQQQRRSLFNTAHTLDDTKVMFFKESLISSGNGEIKIKVTGSSEPGEGVHRWHCLGILTGWKGKGRKHYISIRQDRGAK